MKIFHPLLPSTFPESWAHSFGQDRYGVWHGVYVGEVEARFRWIPPGQFMMGSTEYKNEGPPHLVTFKNGFWLAETACTQALWREVMGQNPSRFKDDQENPVENVSWENAKVFIDKLNRQIPDLGVRLPSESEWEYACRAGTSTAFWFGDELTTDDANYDGNYPYRDGRKGVYRETTMPVKSFRPNPWGLYQMHGNVWEWCEDGWHDDYVGAPDDGSPWRASSSVAVCRGGSWVNCGRFLRSAYRYLRLVGRDFDGLRLARGPER